MYYVPFDHTVKKQVLIMLLAFLVLLTRSGT